MTASISTNVNDWISGTAISGTWAELHNLLSESDGLYKTFASVVDKKFLDRRKKLELWPTEPINRIGVGINSGLWIRRSLPDKIREAVGDDDAHAHACTCAAYIRCFCLFSFYKPTHTQSCLAAVHADPVDFQRLCRPPCLITAATTRCLEGAESSQTRSAW